jgi:hypothetical protein
VGSNAETFNHPPSLGSYGEACRCTQIQTDGKTPILQELTECFSGIREIRETRPELVEGSVVKEFPFVNFVCFCLIARYGQSPGRSGSDSATAHGFAQISTDKKTAVLQEITELTEERWPVRKWPVRKHLRFLCLLL